MIIYGHRPREKEVAEGEFTCPHCQAVRPYKHKRLVRYLTLFFIPVLPLGQLGEKVECQVCFNSFPPDTIFHPAAGAAPLSGPLPSVRPPRSQAKRGWVFVVLGALGVLVAGLIALLVTINQFTLPTGPGDNWQGFVGILILCPLPLGVVSVGVIGWGGYIIRKVRRAWGQNQSLNPSARI